MLGAERTRNRLLLTLLLLALYWPPTVRCVSDVLANTQPYGMERRASVGAFLDGRMPESAPPSEWSAVAAFPHLLFTNALGLAAVPGTSDLLCLWEREGRVWTFTNSAESVAKGLVVDLSAECQGWDDSGLLGLAFHPRFTANHYVFVYYVWVAPGTVKGSPTQRPPPDTACRCRLMRLTLDGHYQAVPGSEVVLIDQDAPSIWHVGGGLAFQPVTGLLFLAIGDNNHAINDQRIDLDLFSSVLRIDVDCRGSTISHPPPRQPAHGRTGHYFIPNDNPFVGQSGVLEEFYGLGLRNPFRISFDAPSGRMFVTDVGEQLREELNVVEPAEPGGLNFQWNQIEGLQGDLTPPYIGVNKRPTLDYTHAEGQAIIGGVVYRGRRFASELGGKYVFGDNVQRKIWALNEAHIPASKTLLCTIGEGPGPSPGPDYTGLSSFGLDQNNEIYICRMSSVGTPILALARTTLPPAQPFPLRISQTGAFSDVTNGIPSEALLPYAVNSPLWSDGAIKQRWAAIPTNSRVQFSAKGEWRFPPGSVFVKTFELPVDDTDSSARDRLETRFLVCDTNGGAYGVSYRWRPNNSDADLQTNAATEIICVAVPPIGAFERVDIGHQVSDVGTKRLEDGYEVTARGSSQGSGDDESRGVWQERVGDFDIQTRIDSLEGPNGDAKAGLMARESLSPGSRRMSTFLYAANRVREGNHGGYECEYRLEPQEAVHAIYPRPPQPVVSFPNGWLRLKRAGNEFTAFASHDGIDWISLGPQKVVMPKKLHFGLVISAEGRGSATARFHLPTKRLQRWYYPSSDDCLSCHTQAAGFVLGVKTRQLNGDFFYERSGILDNQLRAWNHLGLFSPPIPESEIEALDRLASVTNTLAAVETRVRSYLDSNCSQCHRPGGSPALWDARFDTPLTAQRVIRGDVFFHLGLADARVVAPGDPERSILYRRLNTTEGFKMPPLARNTVDEGAVSMVEEWIRGLSASHP